MSCYLYVLFGVVYFLKKSMGFMEILLFGLGAMLGGFITFMYLDLKNTIKEETIAGVEYNDKLYRVFRKFIEKNNPEIIEQCRESL